MDRSTEHCHRPRLLRVLFLPDSQRTFGPQRHNDLNCVLVGMVRCEVGTILVPIEIDPCHSLWIIAKVLRHKGYYVSQDDVPHLWWGPLDAHASRL